jgi:DNA mismatch repair protein MutH
MQTVSSIFEKVLRIVGTSYTLPKTTNKGLPGQFLEDLLGIPHTSNCLDCSDGELKLFPVKQLKEGGFVPKESIAVTMLSPDELRTTEFNASKCCKKMSRMLLVPYYRTEDVIQFMAPKIVDRSECSELYAIVEADYNEIRKKYIETGILQSETGTLLQNRTKGAGHGTTTRAFYLRPAFMKQCMNL